MVRWNQDDDEASEKSMQELKLLLISHRDVLTKLTQIVEEHTKALLTHNEALDRLFKAQTMKR